MTEVQAVIEAKAQLDISIRDAYDRFKKDSGLSAKQIDIDMIDTTRAGDEFRQYVIGYITVHIAI